MEKEFLSSSNSVIDFYYFHRKKTAVNKAIKFLASFRTDFFYWTIEITQFHTGDDARISKF